MDLEHIGWRLFFIRLVEIVFIINIALLDILALRSFPNYRADIATVQTQSTAIPTPTLSPTEAPIALSTTIPTPIIQTNGAKEVYIPLGGGQTTASDWTSIPGVLAYIDSSKYPNIKQVTFEANITVPTANQIVWIQLYDMTDEHPVWYSQMSMNTATQFITQPITLDPGNKLYQVQMKTQLQYPATLDLARIHITLN